LHEWFCSTIVSEREGAAWIVTLSEALGDREVGSTRCEVHLDRGRLIVLGPVVNHVPAALSIRCRGQPLYDSLQDAGLAGAVRSSDDRDVWGELEGVRSAEEAVVLKFE